MNQWEDQGKEYQDLTLEQYSGNRLASQAQGNTYAGFRTQQDDEYSALRQAQGVEYQQAMHNYGDERSKWQESREKAISSAEALLETTPDSYGRAFKGTVASRWLALIAIMIGLTAPVTFFQKRKDVM